MVRPVAIGRKNYPFMGSDNGGKTAAILYGITASAKVKLGRAVAKYYPIK
jgi:hypothetical protein